MIEVKDKLVTAESLSALHEHNKNTYMPMVDPTGSGTMSFDGDITTNYLKTLNGIETDGGIKVGNNVEVGGDIVIKNINDGLYCIHPETNEVSSMVHMNPYGNTVIGYDGYVNRNGNSILYGKDVEHYIASAGNAYYRPYYRVGDTIDVHVRTSGYVTNMGTSVFFTIPLTKPIIGEPMLDIRSDKGFILRQGGKYTHGCDGSTTPATYVHPINYSIDNNFNTGIIVTANFEDITNVVNNDSIGIYLDAKIVLFDPNEIQE